MLKAQLILSNGSTFEGRSIGKSHDSGGEMVFTTGMVGYPQSFTDPSYYGQTLVFSFPLIGNYGLPKLGSSDLVANLASEGMESRKSWLSGVVLSTPSTSFSHHEYYIQLDEWLKQHNITGICDIDTREVVHQIRDNPGLLGKITTKEDKTSDSSFFNPHLTNLVKEVSIDQPITLGKGKKRICVYDFGVKSGIINKLLALDCEIVILPWNSNEALEADGYLLSNGPGNPNHVTEALPIIRKILNLKKPTLGICLGHQLLGLAIGAQVERLKNGHRGFNHPIVETTSKKGFITSQNHGYHIKEDTLPSDWHASFINANDGSVEGISHNSLPFQGVQFHPEASAGPNDCHWILSQFVESLQ